MRLFVFAAALVMGGSSALGDVGRVVAVGDEWPLSDEAFASIGADASALTVNLGAFLVGGVGDVAVFSNHPRLGGGSQGTQFRDTLLAQGHTFVRNPVEGYSLATLQQYDAVVVGGRLGDGSFPDSSILTQYVNAGGNVLLIAGTGAFSNAAGEAGQWDPFLNQFGIDLSGDEFMPTTLRVDLGMDPSAHPLGANVGNIHWGYGQLVSAPITLTADFTAYSGWGHEVVIGASVPGPGGVIALVGLCAMRARRRW
ncbi:hypothetical protein PHYC_02744 [Phycisphaerales bacterium]|nr:hypothetical protein PHYC_02744 [Phycisphaerales bacterium]